MVSASLGVVQRTVQEIEQIGCDVKNTWLMAQSSKPPEDFGKFCHFKM